MSRKKGQTKVKRGPKPKIKKSVSTDSELSDSAPAPEASTMAPSYHYKALEFECGLCESKIERHEKVACGKRGILHCIPKNGHHHKVYPKRKGSSTKLADKIEKIYDESYPKFKNYNPNICHLCYKWIINENKIPERTKSWQISGHIDQDPEHLDDPLYNDVIDCTTCKRAHTPHALFSSTVNPQVKIETSTSTKKTLCGEKLKHNTNTTCSQIHGHDGNCTVTDNVDAILENIGPDSKLQEQVAAKLLQRIQNNTDSNNNTLSLRQVHGRNAVVNLGKQDTRSRRRQEYEQPGFLEFTQRCRDGFWSITETDKHLALYRDIKGNSALIDAGTKDFHDRLDARVEDLHFTAFYWISVKLDAHDKNNLSIERYSKKNCDICLNHDHYTDEAMLDHFDNDDNSCKLQPEKSYRNFKAGKKGDTAEKLFAFAGTDASELVKRVLDHRETQVGDIKRDRVECRIGCDYGQGCTKIVLSLVIDEFEELASSDSHKNQFMLAVTNVGESVQSLKALWKMSGVDKLFDDYQVRICSDLKVYGLAFNLNSTSAKQPCVRCLWKGTIDAKDRENNESHYSEGAPRGKWEQWEEMVEKLESGLASKKCGSVAGLPISRPMCDKANSCIVPPSLHIKLGIVNGCFRMGSNGVFKRKDCSKKVIRDWYDEANITCSSWWEGDLPGIQCTNLINNCESLKDWNPDFYKMVKKFAEVHTVVFLKKDNLCQDDFEKMQKVIDEFMELFEKNEMNYTQKVHWLHRHVMDFTRYTYRTVRFYSEEFIESNHKYFKKFMGWFQGHWIHGHKRAMQCWNRTRFHAPTNRKTRKRGNDFETSASKK